MLITAELELELCEILSHQDQPELFNIPDSEPFDEEETLLEALHDSNFVLHIFSPVTPNQSDSFSDVGIFVMSHRFSSGATFVLALTTDTGIILAHGIKVEVVGGVNTFVR